MVRKTVAWATFKVAKSDVFDGLHALGYVGCESQVVEFPLTFDVWSKSLACLETSVKGGDIAEVDVHALSLLELRRACNLHLHKFFGKEGGLCESNPSDCECELRCAMPCTILQFIMKRE